MTNPFGAGGAAGGDAVEVGRVLDAWGIKGWFKILPYSASPEALFFKRWFLQPAERGAKNSFDGTVLLKIKQARDHATRWSPARRTSPTTPPPKA